MEQEKRGLKAFFLRVFARGNKKARDRDSDMIIIAGLGNPEPKYDGTRHNVGFETLDVLASKTGIALDTHKFHAVFGRGMIGGKKVMLVKPLTYMNLSGESLRQITQYYKTEDMHQLIVISDDVELDVGVIRIRKGGSAGGHNGLKSIIAELGSDGFQRVRVGVGKKPERMDMVHWVLGHFKGEDAEKIALVKDEAADAAELIVTEGADAAMNRYNGVRL